MTDPFAVLGIPPTATAEEVRHAYHLLAKQGHPDQFQDAAGQYAAQERMVALNLAYHEALRLATDRAAKPYTQQIACDDAVQLAQKMLRQRSPESALRQLMRARTRSAAWYNQQGVILMAMEQYDSACQSFREAVKRDPNNIEYRRGALDATLALRKSQTLKGRLKKLLRKHRREQPKRSS